MRLLVAVSCAGALLACLVLGAADARAPLASVEVVACQLGSTSYLREATFEGHMRAVPDTTQMWMRFELYESLPGAPPTLVSDPSVSDWRKSRFGVSSFGYALKVQGLAPGAIYGASVEFRWLDAHGRVIYSVRRRSDACGELGPLAELRIASVSASTGADPASEHYVVDLHNDGTLTERATSVALYVDDSGPVRTRVYDLSPGETRSVAFDAPTCGRELRLVLRRVGYPRQASVDVARCPSIR